MGLGAGETVMNKIYKVNLGLSVDDQPQANNLKTRNCSLRLWIETNSFWGYCISPTQPLPHMLHGWESLLTPVLLTAR